MGTTIDDVLQEQAEQDRYRQLEIERIIPSLKDSLQAERAIEIHDYLPIARSTAENDYILHLWDAFLTLDTLGQSGRGFSTMPFHIMFMLALQYKVLRISKVYSKECELVFCTAGGRSRDQLVNPSKSVFDLALLNERTMPELFKLIELNDEAIKKIKGLVDYRNNNLAHPRGGIETDTESRIDMYLDVLVELQKCLLVVNNGVAKKWKKEMVPEDTEGEYIQLHLAEEYLCPADMRQGKLARL